MQAFKLLSILKAAQHKILKTYKYTSKYKCQDDVSCDEDSTSTAKTVSILLFNRQHL